MRASTKLVIVCNLTWLLFSIPAGAASFSVQPTQRLLFDDMSIVVQGALPGTRVVLTAGFIDREDRQWSSRAEYFANSQGVVDVSSGASVSGTYLGVNADGLIWSMLPVDVGSLVDEVPTRNKEWPTFPKTTPQEPVIISLQASFFASLQASAPTELNATLEIFTMAPGVSRRRLNDESVEGVLFTPAGSGPHPAVLVITGSGGGAPEAAAALLASRGFMALALAHFNYPNRPDELAGIELEYFFTAAERLREWSGASSIGITGGSRGGEGSLLLAATRPEMFAAVVAGVPSNTTWPGCCSPQASAQSAWTYESKPLPGYRFPSSEQKADDDAQPSQRDRDYVRNFLGGMLNPGDAAIKVEKIRAPILLLSGDSDALWPSSFASDQIIARLRAHNFNYSNVHISYPGAGHMASSQSLVTSLSDRAVHPVAGTVIPLGGTPAGNAYAMRDAFRQKVRFFREHLPLAQPSNTETLSQEPLQP